jgi:hypothetical protein
VDSDTSEDIEGRCGALAGVPLDGIVLYVLDALPCGHRCKAMQLSHGRFAARRHRVGMVAAVAAPLIFQPSGKLRSTWPGGQFEPLSKLRKSPILDTLSVF